MGKHTKRIINISLAILGIGLSCISYLAGSTMVQGVLFGLGVSILTTVIINIYETIISIPSKKLSEEKMNAIGLFDIDFNKGNQSQTDVYTNSKKIRMIFSAGMVTLRTYRQAIIDSMVTNQCDVQIVLSASSVLRNGMYMTPMGESDESLKIIQSIRGEVINRNGIGTIELRYSNIGPVGSIEIKDDSYCIVVPYMYGQYSNDSYHTIYKNTGKSDDIYHKWEKHFTKIWEKAISQDQYLQQLKISS